MALVLSHANTLVKTHYFVSLVHFMCLGFTKVLVSKLAPPNIQSTYGLGKTKFKL